MCQCKRLWEQKKYEPISIFVDAARPRSSAPQCCSPKPALKDHSALPPPSTHTAPSHFRTMYLKSKKPNRWPSLILPITEALQPAGRGWWLTWERCFRTGHIQLAFRLINSQIGVRMPTKQQDNLSKANGAAELGSKWMWGFVKNHFCSPKC